MIIHNRTLVGTTSTSSEIDSVRKIGRRGSRPYQEIREKALKFNFFKLSKTFL